MNNPPIDRTQDSGPCHKCGKLILHGQGYYMMDLNVGACAAGAGNMVRCHSECFRGSVSFVAPPETMSCACKFLKRDDFIPAELMESCGFHSKMSKDAERYRWLVENDIHNELFSYGGDKEEIDAAVDAAMAPPYRYEGSRMMELRWAKRRKIKSGMVSTSKVLQWRTITEWVGSDDITKPLQPKWSEWQDVPTEDEE